MAGAKRLSQLAKKWQRGWKHLGGRGSPCQLKMIKNAAVLYRPRAAVSSTRPNGRRFEVPLVYLSMTIFGKLLRLSQEEFGFASDDKITLPCDPAVMEYVMCLLRRNASAEVEGALLSSMVMSCQQHQLCDAYS